MRVARVVAAAVLGTVLATAGALADERDITVVNKTGDVIHSLFVSPVDTEAWEEDVLGMDVLADGESVEISFSGYEEGQCAFDVLATNEDGDQWVLTDLDLCETVTITITAKYIRAQ
jgi:hypothetical protein